MKHDFLCKVLDRYVKEGWFGNRRYHMVVRILTTAEDPDADIASTTKPVNDYEVTVEQYFSWEVGDKLTLTLYQGHDGYWYTSEPI